MTFQSNGPVGNENYSIATGTNPTGPFITLLMTRDPTQYDFNYPKTQRWVNTTTGSEFILIGFSNVTGQTLANWLLLTWGDMPISGTFVPTISLSTPGTSSFTYSAQSAEFTTIGNIVLFSIRIVLTNFTIGTGSGNVQVGSLPIASGAASTNAVFACTLQNITFGAGVLWYTGVLIASPSQLIIFPGMVTSSTQAFLPASALSNTSIINVSGTYFSS